MEEKTGLVKQEDTRQFLQMLIDSKKLPAHIMTVEDAYTVAQMGKELGFSTLQAMHQVIPIQGRLTLSAKAVGALLRRGGVTFTTIEDGVYVYADESTADYKKEGDVAPIDRRTTILFKRGDQEERCSFTWRDAHEQLLTKKSNWVKMPKEMLYARCLAKGANRIGQDLLLGLYMTDSLVDSLNEPENRVQRGNDGFIRKVEEEIEINEYPDDPKE